MGKGAAQPIHSMHKYTLSVLLAACTAAATTCVTADDWTAVKLRGGVFTYVNDHWVQVRRGDVVPDGQVVRTQQNGRVVFARGAEQVQLGGDTQITITDKN